ncbi:Pectic acid lyase [Candidatus Tiddalikarchaeum anstoanum]|nr:Pectic acid lyase [Candidatus Tiddalikarchaeum anstoanum]
MITKKIKDYILNLQGEDGSFLDPVLNIKRNRVGAEIGKSLLFMEEKEQAYKSLNWVLKRQNGNGSWNEIHPDLNEESTVVTSICGRVMVDAFRQSGSKKFLICAKKAADYVLTKEFSPGFFIKSYKHYADVLNVNATVLSFISYLGKELKNKKLLDASERCIFNIARHQFKNGAYPYSTPVQSYPYEYHLNVPDIHYQGTTMYYLLLSKIKNKYLDISLEKGGQWLSNSINDNGFMWEKSHLMFSHKTSGAYGFGAYCFKEQGYKEELKTCINILSKMQNNKGAFPRYEKRFSLIGLAKGCINELTGDASIGLTYETMTRIKRIKERIKRELFDVNFRNDESLLYTSQIFDCLTQGELNE